MKKEFMAVAKGHLVLSDGKSVYFTNLLKIIKMHQKNKDSERKVSMKHIDVRSFHIKETQMVLKGIEDLGSGDAALIVEEKVNHYLTFLRLELYEEDKLATVPRTRLNQIEPSYDPEDDIADGTDHNSPVREVKSVIVAMDDDFNPLQDEMHFAVALREDGTLDFYCNFVYVSSFDKGEIAKKVKRADGEFDKVGEVEKFDLDFSRIFF